MPAATRMGVSLGLIVLGAGCIEGPLPATRDDLALAYADFEQALAANPPSPEAVAALNQAFDAATLRFFEPTPAPTIAGLRPLAARLRNRPGSAGATESATTPGATALTYERTVSSFGAAVSSELSLLSLLNARAIPTSSALETPQRVEVRIGSMQASGWPVARELSLRLQVGMANAAPVLDQLVTAGVSAAGTVAARLELELPTGLAPGVYAVTLALNAGSNAGVAVPAAVWRVTPQALDAVRAENAQRLGGVAADTPALRQALAAALARNALLVEQPDPNDTAAYLADPAQLAADVAGEIAALEAGRDPYVAKRGDYWRVVSTSAGQVPLRVYGPSAAGTGAALPLVVALHGAGGDENMFFAGYGAGRIKQVAEDAGVLVITPRTEPLLYHPELLAEITDAIAADYTLDGARVYLLGHSLGAVAALEIARRTPSAVAAVCCFSGAVNVALAKSLPPTLVIDGTLDPVGAATGLAVVARAAGRAGLPVEFRAAPGYGHTLVVGSLLPEGFSWLLSHIR